jgi:hypothetical protein
VASPFSSAHVPQRVVRHSRDKIVHRCGRESVVVRIQRAPVRLDLVRDLERARVLRLRPRRDNVLRAGRRVQDNVMYRVE